MISSGAVRLEATTSFFVHDGYPAVADYEVTVALVEAAARLGHRPMSGSRQLPRASSARKAVRSRSFPSDTLTSPMSFARRRVLNFEMEASAVMVLAGLRAAGPVSSAASSPSG